MGRTQRKKITCVYEWVDPDFPDKCLYVGGTADFWRRFNRHCVSLEIPTRKDAGPFHRAMDKRYGGDYTQIDMFIIEELPQNSTEEEIKKRETFWYLKLNPEFGIIPISNPERTNEQKRKYWKKYYEKNKVKENMRHKKRRKQLRKHKNNTVSST